MRSAYLHCIINKADKLLFFFFSWGGISTGKGRDRGWGSGGGEGGSEELEGKEKRERSLQTLYESRLGS